MSISIEEGRALVHNWHIGDLVKIKSRDWDAIIDSYSTGIVTAVEAMENERQQLMFALISVYDFKLRRVNKIYPSNLEILSSIK